MGAVARRRPLPSPLRPPRQLPGPRGHRGAVGPRWAPATRAAHVSLLHGLATGALRLLDPEDAHTAAILALRVGLGPSGGRDDPILAGSLAGVALPNVVGLAPGFDKDAAVYSQMLRAGF